MRTYGVIGSCTLVLAVLSLVSACSRSHTVTAETETIQPSTATVEVEFQRTLNGIDPRIRASLGQAAWTKAPDADSFRLLRSISELSQVTSIPSHIDIDSTLSDLETMQTQDWYRDGLTATEETRLAALFSTAAFLGANVLDFDVSSALTASIAESLFVNVSLSGHTVIPIALLSDGSTDSQAILMLASKTLTDLAAFVGRDDHSGIVVVAGASISGCSSFDQDFVRIAVINKACITPLALGLSLVRPVGTSSPGWYSEGFATLVSAVATNSVQNADDLAATYIAHLGRVPKIGEAAAEGGDEEASLAGYSFARALYQVVGKGAVASIWHDVDPGASTSGILDVIRRDSPSKYRSKVAALITDWFE